MYRVSNRARVEDILCSALLNIVMCSMDVCIQCINYTQIYRVSHKFPRFSDFATHNTYELKFLNFR